MIASYIRIYVKFLYNFVVFVVFYVRKYPSKEY